MPYNVQVQRPVESLNRSRTHVDDLRQRIGRSKEDQLACEAIKRQLISTASLPLLQKPPYREHRSEQDLLVAPSHLSIDERDTPSSREIRAFFHFDRPAKARKRPKTSAFSRSLRSFWVAGCVAIYNIIFAPQYGYFRRSFFPGKRPLHSLEQRSGWYVLVSKALRLNHHRRDASDGGGANIRTANSKVGKRFSVILCHV
jgi:hypothetical protein